jgi:hypothetical protein
MTDWRERIRAENNVGKKDISTVKSAEEIFREANNILAQTNAFNLLIKTKDEVWGGQGKVIMSIINKSHSREYNNDFKENFFPKYYDKCDFVAGLRLQSKFLSISYRSSGSTGGNGFPGESKGEPLRDYSKIVNEDYYAITAIHVFRRGFYGSDGIKFKYALKVWDGEFYTGSKEEIGEALPHPNLRRINYWNRFMAELSQPQGTVDSRAEKEDITAINLENCLYQVAKNRISLNKLPPQLAQSKINEIKSADIWNHNEILSINH